MPRYPTSSFDRITKLVGFVIWRTVRLAENKFGRQIETRFLRFRCPIDRITGPTCILLLISKVVFELRKYTSFILSLGEFHLSGSDFPAASERRITYSTVPMGQERRTIVNSFVIRDVKAIDMGIYTWYVQP